MHRSLVILFLIAVFPLQGLACSLQARTHGTSINPPVSLVEVRVLKITEIQLEIRPNRFTDGQETEFEVVRPLLGASQPGDRITRRYESTSGCLGHRLSLDNRALMSDEDGDGNYDFVSVVGPNDSFYGLLGEIFDPVTRWRMSPRRSLKKVRLSGEISDDTAEQLLRLSNLDTRGGCEVSMVRIDNFGLRVDQFAHVACGHPAGGDSMRPRVIFERVGPKWIEVMRWNAPGISPAGASAATTS